MPQLTPEDQKAIMKEALQEWLEAKYAQVGKWTLHGIMAALLVALTAFLASHGFKFEDFAAR